jgi:metallo-beta-lactamase family protein
MCEAGRIKHHLKHNIWKKESTIIFVGYQAEGTLGRRILEGEKDLKILGENIRVKAEIYNAEGFSAHADKINMLEWLQGFKEKPKKVFLVHGEPDSKKEFAEEIEKQLGMSCIIPEYNTAYEIKSSTAMEEVDLSDELITGRRETANKEEVEILLKNLQDLKVMFENAFSKTEGYLKDQLVNKEAYKKINNNILELENELINLKMLGNGH